MAQITGIQAEPQIRELSADEIDYVSGGEQKTMASLKLLSEMLSNISKTRAEISSTFARNIRA